MFIIRTLGAIIRTLLIMSSSSFAVSRKTKHTGKMAMCGNLEDSGDNILGQNPILLN